MATRRQPKMGPDEKAAITQAAKDLAHRENELRAQVKEAQMEANLERRRSNARAKAARNREKENAEARKKRRLARNGTVEKRKCHGLNMFGQPCGQSPLIPARWEGAEEISGLYCLHHEPMIDRESRIAFQLTGSTKNKAYRRVTPGEIAHELIQSAPHHFLRPYLKALGLEMSDTGEITQKGTGLKLHGFSRGGEVIRSAYPDYTGQVQVAEKLLDRVYGKARQAVDLAAQNTTVAVNINMDVDRVSKVAEVLRNAGALPNGNGNGNGHIDVPDAEVVDELNLPHDDIDV